MANHPNRGKKRRWHEVTMAELEKVWADLRAKDICYNGCTHAALVEKYGADNLKHVMGHGWYKLVAAQS